MKELVNLFSRSATLTDGSGSPYVIEALSRDVMSTESGRIAEMLDDIQGVTATDRKFLLADELDGRPFFGKWSLSCVVRHAGTGKVAGVLIAYLRTEGDNHPLDSVYLHRLAIALDARGQGLGTGLVLAFLDRAFSLVPWLCNVTVQVTTDPPNAAAQRVYEKSGFERVCAIAYPNKFDALLRVGRTRAPEAEEMLDLQHPRAPRSTGQPPLLHLATSNPRKAGELGHIFTSLNVLTATAPRGFKLIEPQIEFSDPETELVQHPLRLAARFLEKNHRILPFVVEDTMLYVEHFNRDYEAEAELPGYDTKRWWKQLGDDGLLELMGGTTRRKARYVSQLGGYSGSGRYVVGRGEVRGTISLDKRSSKEAFASVPATSPWFFHTIFVPDGSDRTLAEMDALEFARFDYKRRAAHSFIPKLYSDPTNPQLDLPLPENER